MNLEPSDAQNQIRDLVERFIREHAPVTQRRSAQESLGLAMQLAGFGLFALPFEDWQGPGRGAVELAVMMEALGAGLLGGPVLNHVLHAGALLHLAGTPAQQSAWMPRLIDGTARLAVAHEEHGSDGRGAPATRAVAGAGHYTLDGAKTFVFADAGVDGFLVSASLAPLAGAEGGSALFLVPPDVAGLARRDYRLIDGSDACELELRAVKLPAEARLAGGQAALDEVRSATRLYACAEMLGVMTLLFNETLAYVRSRKQFGAPLSSFQAIRHRLVDLYVLLEESRSLVYRAALMCGSGDEWRSETLGAKAYVSDAAMRVGHECIQFHGGMGVTDELLIGHGHKRLVLLSRSFGDGDAALEEYARA